MLNNLLITNKILYDNAYISYNTNANGYVPITASATLTFPLNEFYEVGGPPNTAILIKLPDATGIDLPNFTFRFHLTGNNYTTTFTPYFVDVAPPATSSPFYNVNLPVGTVHNGVVISVSNSIKFTFNTTLGSNYAFGLQIRNGNWYVYV